MTAIRLFIVSKDGKLSSRYSSQHATPEDYRRANSVAWPERKYIAWENPAVWPTTSPIERDRVARCRAAIERGHHFGTKEAALALLAAAILEAS